MEFPFYSLILIKDTPNFKIFPLNTGLCYIPVSFKTSFIDFTEVYLNTEQSDALLIFNALIILILIKEERFVFRQNSWTQCGAN